MGDRELWPSGSWASFKGGLGETLRVVEIETGRRTGLGVLRPVKKGPRKRRQQRRWGRAIGEGTGAGGCGSESWEGFKEAGRPTVHKAAGSSNVMRAEESL